MHLIDLTIFIVYLIAMLAVGFYFSRKNSSEEDYYVGGRSLNKWHIGLSVVATDVGGGFSIGLGGLGFAMGLSGSHMLLCGLIGAILAGTFLIPVVYKLARNSKLFTFPQILDKAYGPKVAFLAAIISLIGYWGFTASQILAGAKLASATFDNLSLQMALWVMGGVAVIYTVLGGIKAVIYTDTIQWALLLTGLIGIGIPLSLNYVGGIGVVLETLPASYFSLTNLSWVDVVNWGITIIPIWFIGMTLYQRIFACKSEKEAKKAWYIAGVFEWPIMAFMGVFLGLIARVAVENAQIIPGANFDPELGLPLLLKTVLPSGLLGIMMAAYFSAILSTADSCLMAASGNLTTDIIGAKLKNKGFSTMKLSKPVTLLIGLVSIFLASQITQVLELMLMSYAFMVSGLLVPVLMALFAKRVSARAAFYAMLSGGICTLTLQITEVSLPLGLNPNLFGLSLSLIVYLLLALILNTQENGIYTCNKQQR